MRTIKVCPRLPGAVRPAATSAAAFLAAGLIAFGLAGTAQAAGPGGSYIQGAYADWDDADNGFNLGGSLMVTPSVRAFADYTDTDLEQLRIGGGAIVPMSGPLGLEIGGSYQSLETGGRGGLDDDGFGFHGIARFAATPVFTLSGKAEYVLRDELDDDIVFGADADYRFTPQLSGFVSYEVYDEIDSDLMMAGARLHF